MKLLFLDDNPDRHFLIDRALGHQHQIIHTYTAMEVVKAVRDHTYISLALLDYDLGPHKINGLQIVNYLYFHLPANQWFGRIISHTRNHHNGLQLVSRASKWGMQATYQPFSAALLRSLV